MEYKLDMTMMFAIHDALRRDLERVGRLAAARGAARATLGGADRRRLEALVGWELFKKFLVNHHESEDEALWPALRAAVAANPDQLALVDALEAEHAVIDPLLAAIDTATPDRFGDLVDELHTKLSGHLAHEENDGLALIDVSITEQEWQHFSSVNSDRNRPDAAMYLPWLLDGVTDQDTLLKAFPPPLAAIFREKWAAAYAALDVWKGL